MSIFNKGIGGAIEELLDCKELPKGKLRQSQRSDFDLRPV